MLCRSKAGDTDTVPTTEVGADQDESQDSDWVVEENEELKKFTENWKRTEVSMIELEPLPGEKRQKSKTKIKFEKWQDRKNHNALLLRDARKQEYDRNKQEYAIHREALTKKKTSNKRSQTTPEQKNRITSCMLRLAGMTEMNTKQNEDGTLSLAMADRSGQPINKPKTPCVHFAAGYCKRAQRCPFAHAAGLLGVGPFPLMEQQSLSNQDNSQLAGVQQQQMGQFKSKTYPVSILKKPKPTVSSPEDFLQQNNNFISPLMGQPQLTGNFQTKNNSFPPPLINNEQLTANVQHGYQSHQNNFQMKNFKHQQQVEQIHQLHMHQGNMHQLHMHQGNMHQGHMHQVHMHRGNMHQGNMYQGNMHQGNMHQGNMHQSGYGHLDQSDQWKGGCGEEGYGHLFERMDGYPMEAYGLPNQWREECVQLGQRKNWNTSNQFEQYHQSMEGRVGAYMTGNRAMAGNEWNDPNFHGGYGSTSNHDRKQVRQNTKNSLHPNQRNVNMYQEQTKPEMRKPKKAKPPIDLSQFFCEVCSLQLKNSSQYWTHMASQEHCLKMAL
ncbi:hypothetical protein ScPMuIL_017659 [Solemya velum]